MEILNSDQLCLQSWKHCLFWKKKICPLCPTPRSLWSRYLLSQELYKLKLLLWKDEGKCLLIQEMYFWGLVLKILIRHENMREIVYNWVQQRTLSLELGLSVWEYGKAGKKSKCGLSVYIWNHEENSDRIQEIFNQSFNYVCSWHLVNKWLLKVRMPEQEGF